MRWFEDCRQQWIAETLRIFGTINRGHLMRKFGISTPQASKDLNRYMRAHPGAAYYDPHRKAYFSFPETED